MGAFDDAWDEVDTGASGGSSFDSIWDSEPAPGPKEQPDYLMGALKGIARAGSDVIAAPADLVYRGGNAVIDAITGQDTNLEGFYPSQLRNQFLDYLSNNTGDKTTEELTQLGGNLATVVAAPSQAKTIASKIPVISKLAQGEGALSTIANLFAKGAGYAAEGGAYGALGNTTSDNLGTEIAKGAALNTVIPAIFGTAGKAINSLRPDRGAAKTAQEIAEELRTIVPDALTEAVTPAERAVNAANALEATAKAKLGAAGDLFENLPKDTAVLDDAIKATKAFAEEVGGPITPGGRTGQIVDFIERLKPKDKVIDIPASTILDDAGRPLVEATQEVIKGGPAKVPLSKVQNTLRDIRTVGEGAQGVDRAVLGTAKKEILAATKASVKPESWEAFEQARSTWAKVANQFDKGAVGKVRKSLTNEGTGLEAFKKALLGDPKGARQLAKVMSPEEINNAQDLMLSDLLTRQPVSWARRVTQKLDSYEAIFGKEGTERILRMVGRDGSIGSKLLQDNNGLKSLFARLASRIGGGALVGGALGGDQGAIAGGLAGAGSAATKGPQVARIQSILMRAAAGSDEALAILNSPAAGSKIPDALGRLADIMSGFMSKDTSDKTSTTQPQIESVDKSPSSDNTTISEMFKGEDMQDEKPKVEELAPIKDNLLDAVRRVESADGKYQLSKAGARGEYQFMPATAKAYNVDLNDGNAEDDREGAWNLIQDEYKALGSLPLALASYNAGRRRVNQAIQMAQSREWPDVQAALREMGLDETADYVTKYQKLGIEV